MRAYRRRTSTSLGLIAVVCLVVGTVSTIDSIPGVGELHAQASWRGLVVAPEQRCSPYDADDYRYPQSVEDRIVDELCEVCDPYAIFERKTGSQPAAKFNNPLAIPCDDAIRGLCWHRLFRGRDGDFEPKGVARVRCGTAISSGGGSTATESEEVLDSPRHR